MEYAFEYKDAEYTTETHEYFIQLAIEHIAIFPILLNDLVGY